MRIERLQIHNFRRFREVDLEMPDGVIALVGRNGAGKSTLLEAVGWCLFGNEAARTGKDLIKRQGAAPGDDVRVTVAFRLGAHSYEVTRELLGKSQAHVASVAVDERIVVPGGAQSHREATAWIEKLFHMDRQSFFTSLVARQRELAALTDAPAATRKKILIGLLRLDALDDAIQTARQRKRDARAELAGLRSAMKDPKPLEERLHATRLLLGSDRERVEGVVARIAKMEEESEETRARRDASRQRADAHRAAHAESQLCEQRLQHLAAVRQRHEADLARARVAKGEAATLAPQLDALPALQQRLERLTALQALHEELARCRADLQRALAEAAKARADEEAAAGALAAAGAVRSLSERVEKQRAVLDAALADAQQRAADLAARAQQAARQLADAEATATRIRRMGPESPCPTCTRPLHEHHDALLHGLADELARHRAALAQIAPALEAARAAEQDARRQTRELADREQELRQKHAALAREEERLANARLRAAESSKRAEALALREKALAAEPFDPAELARVRQEARRLEALRDRHARLAADAAREDEVVAVLKEVALSETDARAALDAARAKRDALGFDPAAHEALEAAAVAAQARLGEARVERERLLGEHARRLDEEKRLVADLAQQADLARRAGDLERRVALLERLAGEREQGLLPEFKDHLIGRVRPILSMHAGRLFRDLTDGRYADLEVAEDYGLRVHEDGEAFALERFSGGEGDLANLCLRLAVSQVVAERAGAEGFGFLALDEVFGSQDEGRKANILRALKGLSGRFRQILLITHIPDVKESAERVLRVEALDDGTSRVVLEG